MHGRWTFSRRHAFHVLGLDGTGALHPLRLRGVVRIERGGVCVIAAPEAHDTLAALGG